MEKYMITIPLDDYEEKAKDQRTLEILREMTIRDGSVCSAIMCAMLEIDGEPWKERRKNIETVDY